MGKHRAPRNNKPLYVIGSAGSAALVLTVGAVFLSPSEPTPRQVINQAAPISALPTQNSKAQLNLPTQTTTEAEPSVVVAEVEPTTTTPTTTQSKPTTTTDVSTTTTTNTQPPTTTTSPRTTTRPPEPVVEAQTASCDSSLDGTRPHVARVGNYLKNKFNVGVVIGRAGRAGPSDHPSGHAIDFMVGRDTGDAISDYVLSSDNWNEFGIKYVIWKQRINLGNGWELMEDRGGVTANHFDHVHISFNTSNNFNC